MENTPVTANTPLAVIPEQVSNTPVKMQQKKNLPEHFGTSEQPNSSRPPENSDSVTEPVQKVKRIRFANQLYHTRSGRAVKPPQKWEG